MIDGWMSYRSGSQAANARSCLAGSQPRSRRHQRSLLKFSPPPNAFLLSSFNTTLVTQPKQGGRLDGFTTQTYDIIPGVRGFDTDAVQFSFITLHHLVSLITPHHPSSLLISPLFYSSSRPLSHLRRAHQPGLDRIPEQFLAAASRSRKRVSIRAHPISAPSPSPTPFTASNTSA
jgi:hypothetical protein